MKTRADGDTSIVRSNITHHLKLKTPFYIQIRITVLLHVSLFPHTHDLIITIGRMRIKHKKKILKRSLLGERKLLSKRKGIYTCGGKKQQK